METQKPENKNKRTTIIRKKEEFGLNAIDFSMIEKASLKITWLKHLCSDNNRPWNYISLSLLSSVGRNFLVNCNYDVKSLCLRDHLPIFYRKIILYCTVSIMNRIIWNNRFITINNVPVFFRTWSQNGIQTLADLVNSEKNGLISFKDFFKKFNIKGNFVQFYSLISAIASHWKVSLKEEDQCVFKDRHINRNKLTCKSVHSILKDRQQHPPPPAEKRLCELGFDSQEQKRIYSPPFQLTREIKVIYVSI